MKRGRDNTIGLTVLTPQKRIKETDRRDSKHKWKRECKDGEVD